MLCDLNDMFEFMTEAGEFGVTGVNDNERRLLNMCRDTSMRMKNKYSVLETE